ncbi:MAG: MCP four helix bundle domain-containing protein [Anaerolineaceae bacterium]|nr:MCP four helix bundle domain-containing protein [Anaerolineaceae bacterium]
MKANIFQRLLLAFTVVFLLFSGMSIFAITQINRLASISEDIFQHPLQVTRAVITAEANIIRIHRSMKDIAYAANVTELENAVLLVDKYENVVYQQFDIVEERILGEEGQDLIADTIILFEGWKPIRDEVISFSRQGEQEAAAAITKGKGAEYVSSLENEMETLRNYAAGKASDLHEKAQTGRIQVMTWSIILLVAAILGSSVFVFIFSRRISTPLRQVKETALDLASKDLPSLANGLKHLADGDLTHKVYLKAQQLNITRSDEVGELADAFNQIITKMKETGGSFDDMIDSQNQTLNTIAYNGNSMATATNQILAATTEQVASISEQAAAVAETTATVEEARKTAEQAAERTQLVSEMAKQTRDLADVGQNAVQDTIQAMGNIKEQVNTIADTILMLSEQTQQIGNIINTVNDIADQSNLLAVNAAIEAARAGDAGRGFAVVANEVGSLAKQSQQATAQVRDILSEIQKAANRAVMVTEEGTNRAETGMTQVGRAGEAFEEINDNIIEVSQASLQISASTKEQLAGMDQIANAIFNINNAAYQNEAGMKQIQAATQEMNRMANQLSSLVNQYKLSDK